MAYRRQRRCFPPNHIAWLRGYEHNPDTPLEQTYHKGIVKQDFDPTTPTIRIGILFLEGADIPAVTYAEMNRETRKRPDQKSLEWRVVTAATLLRRLQVRDDFTIIRLEDSRRTAQADKIKEPKRKYLLHDEQNRL